MILLLCISFFIRIYRLEYPGILSSKWGDGTRDYLVAHYIRSYGEFPLIGPFNLLFDQGLRNSPLYYYLLALFLVPFDNVMTLGVVNVFLQLFSIFLIYQITKVLFDHKSAILAVLLFSFTPEILRQTQYIWQPTVMQSVALLSLYLLGISYLRKSYKALIGSVTVFNMAAVLHNSILSWFPQFCVLSLLITRLQYKNFRYFLGVILVFVSTLVFLYLPTFVYFLGQHSLESVDYIKNTEGLYLKSVGNYLDNLSYNFSQTLQVFSFGKWLILLQTVALIAYFFLERSRKRWFLIFSIGFFLEPIIISSFFNKNQLHYLTASFGIFMIIVSVTTTFLVDRLLVKSPFLKVVFLSVAALLLLKIFSSDFKFLYPEKAEAGNEVLINLAADSIKSEVQVVKAEEKFNSFNFFQIISYANKGTTFRYPTLDTILLVPLEKKLKTKLAKISDNSPYSLVQTNDKSYIFVSCFEFDYPAVIDCSTEFLNAYPGYIIKRNVFNQYPLSVYLTKRDST